MNSLISRLSFLPGLHSTPDDTSTANGFAASTASRTFPGFKPPARIMGTDPLSPAIRTTFHIDGMALPVPPILPFLLDTYEKGRMGGTGRAIPSMWKVVRIAGERGSVPIILAGGLNPGNVREAVEAANPFAVDVSSGVECSPGKKDKRLIREFIQAAKGF